MQTGGGAICPAKVLRGGRCCRQGGGVLGKCWWCPCEVSCELYRVTCWIRGRGRLWDLALRGDFGKSCVLVRCQKQRRHVNSLHPLSSHSPLHYKNPAFFDVFY